MLVGGIHKYVVEGEGGVKCNAYTHCFMISFSLRTRGERGPKPAILLRTYLMDSKNFAEINYLVSYKFISTRTS